MDRRAAVAFLMTMGAALLSAPLDAFAQTRKIPRIGFFVFGSRASHALNLDAFLQGMRELGYVEGRDFTLELRWGSGDPERLSRLAVDLVKLSPDVIVLAGTAVTQATKLATNAIPLVMASGSDPVETGIVKSLARPGGNVTGLTNMTVDSSSKLVELARSVVPNASRAAVMMTASAAQQTTWRHIQHAAQELKLELIPVKTINLKEIEAGLAGIAGKADVLIVQNDSLFFAHRSTLAEFSRRIRLPSVYARAEYVEAGGLASYGSNLKDQYRRAANYVDRILKGAKPAELPIERASVFELTVNLRTAREIGVAVPQSLLLRADRVIDH